jgi:hypothetical protein
VQRRKEDGAVGENGRRSAAKFGLCAAPIVEEREWEGSGWRPCGGKDGWGGSGGCRWRDTHLVGDGHDPGAVAPGRARERQGNREKGESRGGW